MKQEEWSKIEEEIDKAELELKEKRSKLSSPSYYWNISLQGVVSLGGNKTKEIAIKNLIKYILKAKIEQVIDNYENRLFPKALKMDRENLRKKIEGMKVKIHNDLTTKQPEDIEGFNQALEEVIKLL